ncbi:LacI family DNA-binding transcriptional regulator [Cellulomonas wangsupingiae]|uniref:Substrate-binding domain-containing protein n=1 Tax=Cellulomonas wangsupingiae TaxID=2968085 RepID=A0ABY5K817_9CELL|nr:substrate-binding domain-containing protein [Cellulomonas wangsupingiae]MCC2334859.1 substrate-binding domain-containing protein [Cellulomonas wangsupingiae]MCM0638421.1 substrate-binding domain-containing protein [Cellulomonas wangsupingiae]UUI66193.1 substrate-binding domain-containing protein [Cellulomonas wangsupingiae]
MGADAIGLVLARPARMLGLEPFFMELIGGIEETLSTDDRSLLLHVVPDHEAEIAAYRRWGPGHLVDAVVLVNLVVADPRLAVLRELGIPTVVVGGPERALSGAAHVWIDNSQAMRDAVGYLVDLGHTTIGRVSGPAALAHTRSRTEAFLAECAARDAHGVVVEGDYGQESGTRAARTLLGRNDPPSALVFDNDVMALAALGVANELGLSVPGDVSLLAWDDSPLCRLSHPPLSAMSLDVHAMGVQVADAVLNLLASGRPTTSTAPLPRLVARGSTARRPR